MKSQFDLKSSFLLHTILSRADKLSVSPLHRVLVELKMPVTLLEMISKRGRMTNRLTVGREGRR